MATTVPPNLTVETDRLASSVSPTKIASAPVLTPRAGGATSPRGVPALRKSSSARRVRSGTSIQGPGVWSDRCFTRALQSNPRQILCFALADWFFRTMASG